MRKSTKWIAILSVAFSAAGVFFMLRAQTLAFFNPIGIWGIERQYFYALVLLVLGAICLIVTFLRFIRARSLMSGILATTIMSAGLFYAAAKFLPFFSLPNATQPVNPTNQVLGNTAAGGTGFALHGRYTYNIGSNFTVNLAQIGLFAIWVLVLAVLIYLQTRPISRIQKVLENIVDGESCQVIRIGKSKQFNKIEQELSIISATICQHQMQQAKKVEEQNKKQKASSVKNKAVKPKK